MTYTTDIPVSGDTLGGTRDRIRTNFQEIFNVNGVNHVDYNASGKGKHKFLQMPDQASLPPTAANEGGLFCSSDSNGVTQIYFRGESSGSSYQLTRATNGADPNLGRFGTNTAYVANHTGGWTFLPGGLILQYGFRSSMAQNANNTITFPRTFPSAVFSVTTTAFTTGTSVNTVNVNQVTTSNFRIYNPSSGTVTSMYWQAIGN